MKSVSPLVLANTSSLMIFP